MFTKIPNTNVSITTVTNTVPTAADVKEHGVIIDAEALLIYYTRVAGEVIPLEVPVEHIQGLLGINHTIVGEVRLERCSHQPYSLVQMDDIGTIVVSGDLINLPLGMVRQVLFVVNDDKIAVEGTVIDTHFTRAAVGRAAVASELMLNPTPLAEIWDTIRPSHPSVEEPEPEPEPEPEVEPEPEAEPTSTHFILKPSNEWS